MNKINDNHRMTMIALILIAFGVFLRVLPHPDNFTPIGAITAFSGIFLPLSIALWVPLLMMMISDLWLGLHSLTWLTWATFVACVLLSSLAKKNQFKGLFFSSILGCFLFFIVSNLGVFLVDGLYPKTFEGFVTCFIMALPFLKNQLLADLLYTAVFYGLYVTARKSFLSSVKIS